MKLPLRLWHGADGFAIVDALVASALTLALVAVMAALIGVAGQVSAAEPDAMEMQQRARSALATLVSDLQNAGAGIDLGPRAAPLGPLNRFISPILPRRIGVSRPDSPDTARPDVISFIWVGKTAAQSAPAMPMAGPTFTVVQRPGCPPADLACGFQPGMSAMMVDASAHLDLYTVTGVVGPAVSVRSRGPSSGHAHGPHSVVAEADARTFYFDPITRQLRQYDTDATDAPVIDDVNAFRVEYFGTASPPARPRPEVGEANCLYDAAGQPIAGLSVLAAEHDGLAALPLEMFRDGPWCGSGGSAFDVDLLRIRRARITMRLEAAPVAARGSGPGFHSAGIGRSVWRLVPDFTTTIDIAPRNLGLDD